MSFTKIRRFYLFTSFIICHGSEVCQTQSYSNRVFPLHLSCTVKDFDAELHFDLSLSIYELSLFLVWLSNFSWEASCRKIVHGLTHIIDFSSW